jgi:hypothetical protein
MIAGLVAAAPMFGNRRPGGLAIDRGLRRRFDLRQVSAEGDFHGLHARQLRRGSHPNRRHRPWRTDPPSPARIGVFDNRALKLYVRAMTRGIESTRTRGDGLATSGDAGECCAAPSGTAG